MVLEISNADYGGIIIGNEGEWLRGFSKYIEVSDSYTTELWGVYEGLQLTTEMSFTSIDVNSDA